MKQNYTKFEANISPRRGKVIHIKTQTWWRERLCSEWQSLNTESIILIIIIIIIIIFIYITATQVAALNANSSSRSTSLASLHRRWHAVTQYHASYTRHIERTGIPTCPRDSDSCDGDIVWLLGHFPAKIAKTKEPRIIRNSQQTMHLYWTLQ